LSKARMFRRLDRLETLNNINGSNKEARHDPFYYDYIVTGSEFDRIAGNCFAFWQAEQHDIYSQYSMRDWYEIVLNHILLTKHKIAFPLSQFGLEDLKNKCGTDL